MSSAGPPAPVEPGKKIVRSSADEPNPYLPSKFGMIASMYIRWYRGRMPPDVRVSALMVANYAPSEKQRCHFSVDVPEDGEKFGVGAAAIGMRG
jgi:hypothetical protein